MYPPFVNRVLKKIFEFLIFRTAQKICMYPAPLRHKGPIPPIRGKWPEGPKGVGTLAQRAKRGRDAGPKGLRGFERCKFRRTATSCKTLVGAGSALPGSTSCFFTEICVEPALFFVIDDRFYSVGTHIRNLQLPISIFFYFSKRKRWQKKTSPEGFRFPSGSP